MSWILSIFILAILGITIAILVIQTTHSQNLTKLASEANATNDRLSDLHDTYQQQWSNNFCNTEQQINNESTDPKQRLIQISTPQDQIIPNVSKAETLQPQSLRQILFDIQPMLNTLKEEIEQTRTQIHGLQKEIQYTPYMTMALSQKATYLNPRHEVVTISVVIPIYNGEEYFADCLNSVINQTTPPLEILVGVNGHTEDSKIVQTIQEIIDETSSDIRIHLFVYSEPDKVLTLNKLVQASHGSYIALLDVDDEWMPDKLSKQMEILNKYNVDVLGTQCEYTGDKSGSPIIKAGLLHPIDFFRTNQIINSSVLIKKQYAHWNPTYSKSGVDDYELWLRLIHTGAIFYNVPDILVYHRVHESSQFNGSLLQSQSVVALRKAYNIPE